MPSTSASAIARNLVLFCLAALVLSLSLENWTGASFSIIRWLIQIVPLLLFIPPLLKSGLRPYQWLCFVILLYFLLGVLYLFTPSKLLAGSVITFLCVLLFCSAIFYIHRQQRQTMS